MLTENSPNLRRFLVTVAAVVTAFALMTAAAALPTRAAGADPVQPALAGAMDLRLKAVEVDHRDRDRDRPGLHRRDGRGEVRGVPARPPHVRSPHIRPPQFRPPHAHRPHMQPPRPHRPRAIVLPANCEARTSGRHGPRMVYLARCLQQAGIQRDLPRRCEMPVLLRGRNVLAYDRHCLIEAGFRPQGFFR
ncbi:hypothetical protein [Szabonella alba]|uniref:Uncharacterized protein n=1 Tax=Szabonella alba TaxID=2804194 RepID=A0A8K0VGQ3_9RHOB|nr:hypothetical protein [Szabonella alba]MBL4919092.1 hypothetical protein [Szabonella alba]